MVEFVVHLCPTQRFAVLVPILVPLDETVLVTDNDTPGTKDSAKETLTTSDLFSPLDESPTTTTPYVFMIQLEDFLLHKIRQKTDSIRKTLLDALKVFGFVVLTTRRESRSAKVIQAMRNSTEQHLFPKNVNVVNAANLKTSDWIYVSERGVPMYKLGYELCEDHVREVFRVAAGDPDGSDIWPDLSASEEHPQHSVRNIWLRGIGLMRHVTDTALDLLIGENDNFSTMQQGCSRRRTRRYSGHKAWLTEPNRTPLDSRPGDFSVLYTMHYFNGTKMGVTAPEPGIAVKAHVDPSLLVCEPFLCTNTTGLQVWIRNKDAIASKWNLPAESNWLDCDGPESPLLNAVNSEKDNVKNEAMLLFVGKGIQSVIPDLEPTLHRVIIGDHPRKSVIYEQKYEEFFPPPVFD